MNLFLTQRQGCDWKQACNRATANVNAKAGVLQRTGNLQEIDWPDVDHIISQILCNVSMRRTGQRYEGESSDQQSAQKIDISGDTVASLEVVLLLVRCYRLSCQWKEGLRMRNMKLRPAVP